MAAIEDIEAHFDYLTEHVSLWDAADQCERLLKSTDKLVDFPRLYEAAPEYGEGVRRISRQGRHILYEVDDQAKTVRVLAVVGQRQNPKVNK